MRDKFIRTLGATGVLIGITVAAIAQIAPGGDPSAIAIIPDASTAPAEPETTNIPETTTTTSADPFTYSVGVLAGVSTDNFWAFYGEEPSVWNSYILGPTKSALFRVDPVTSRLIPELAAAEAEPSFDAVTWFVEVDLRSDFTWSDGEAITARDFVFTFETVRGLKLGGSWAAAFPPSISSVQALDSHTLRIEFEGRPTIAVWPNAVGMAPVMAEHVWADRVSGATSDDLYAEGAGNDVGGGPLAIAEVTEDSITSVANPGYPLGAVPETVSYVVFDNEASAIAALGEGKIHTILTPKGLSAESEAALSEITMVAVEQSPANGVRYLGFNLEQEPMADPAFRKALALLLDRETLARNLVTGSEVAYGFIRQANELWYDAKRAGEIAALYTGPLEDRLAEALAGLREAGYRWDQEPRIAENGAIEPGKGLTIDKARPAPLTILTPGDAYDPARPEYVAEIATTLSLLGFDARPVVTDFDTVVDLAFGEPSEGRRQYDMYLLGWTLGNPALPDHYRPLFASGGVMNNTGYSSDEFDKRLRRYERSESLEDARDQLWAMETILASDLPYLLLYTTEITEAYRSDRVGYGVRGNIGGIQGRLGGIADVGPAG